MGYNFDNLETVNSCLKHKDSLLNSTEIENIKKDLIQATKEEKKILGQKLNQIKEEINQKCNERIQEIQKLQIKDDFLDFDPTFFSSKYLTNDGNLHLITIFSKKILDIFSDLGFVVSDGPLLETQEYCFDLLNMPSYHPARGMQDTFYLEKKDKNNKNYVLRTHTSSVQIRFGKNNKPPFKMVSCGKVFRNEKIDATHDITFNQVECLIINKQVTLSHLKSLITIFYRKFFENDSLKVRFRTSYFPYTIPSLEVDVSNIFSEDKNSRLYGQKWIEIGGSGLVHRQVIENLGLDSSLWQGLAFGFGIERMIQLKLQLQGINQFYQSDYRLNKGYFFSPFVNNN